MYLGPCGSEFADLHPLPAFFPIFSVFHRFGSIGDLPLLQHQIHGTKEVWAEVGGSEVWIQMDGPQGATGRVQVNAHLTPPPPNDLRANRILLPSAPVRVTGRSAGATTEHGEFIPSVAALPPGSSRVPRSTVWWEWQAPTTGLWVLRFPTASDHYLVVYRGPVAPETPVAALTAYAPAVFLAETGELFQIGAFGIAGPGGNLEFSLEQASAPRLNRPTLQTDGAARLWWSFAIPAKWDLPFEVESSPDLRIWTPLVTEAEGLPRTGSFRIPFDAEKAAAFLRLRVNPP